MEQAATIRQKDLLGFIYNSVESEGFAPSFEELKQLLNVKSNQAVIDLLSALERKGLIAREEGKARSITITPTGYDTLNKPSLTPVLGKSYAGPMTATYEQSRWTKLSDEVKIKQDMF